MDLREKDQQRFNAIWELALVKSEYEVLLRYGNTQEHHNAWGSLYIALDGDFGKWLRSKLSSNKRKEIKINIPHSDYQFMTTYAETFQAVFREYGIQVRNDIEFN